MSLIKKEIHIISDVIAVNLLPEELAEYNKDRTRLNIRVKELLTGETVVNQELGGYPALATIYKDCSELSYKLICQLQGDKRTESVLNELKSNEENYGIKLHNFKTRFVSEFCSEYHLNNRFVQDKASDINRSLEALFNLIQDTNQVSVKNYIHKKENSL